ncbi:uncharacterized protein A1O9_05548 [Exophiala aquamarina CBS 119918]|uniref:Uncharacterized protein n=1 Tax=Exophiala aquamarina CBS 119918 TaxID=1182545 RepID=A0A072PQ39_9EURO|nr:uncharacterized protein A1O9_05548 [Exophiala aquamarina CBS 119918]KEF57630.1 hypothetical protein A1O9_05548 [Exophiala aquamarina CBS 119918]
MRKKGHAAFTLAKRLLENQTLDFGMEQMVSEFLDHIGAGIDATADRLVFLMWELSQAHNGERMARLADELRTVDKAGHYLGDLP